MQSESDTKSDEPSSTDEAPGALFIVPGENEQVYVIEGKPVDANRKLAAEIAEDLRTVIDRATTPSREVQIALASHGGDRAHIEIHGEFPGLNHGFGEGTRFSEVYFQHGASEPSESAIPVDLPDV